MGGVWGSSAKWINERGGWLFQRMPLFFPSRWHRSQVSRRILTPAGQFNTNADLESDVASGWPQSLGKNINPSVHKWLTFSVACLWTNRWRLSGPTNQGSLLSWCHFENAECKSKEQEYFLAFNFKFSSCLFLKLTSTTWLVMRQLNPRCSFCNNLTYGVLKANKRTHTFLEGSPIP